MDENHFPIEPENIDAALMHLLINVSAKQMAMQQFILQEKIERTGEDFHSLGKEFDESIAFHKGEIKKNLYENFASIKDALPPDNKKD